jgi:NAD(P)H dehydrogenase (quinone)
MHVLIVHAHPEPASFTAALKDTAVRALSAAGHRVEVSDLYSEAFNPVAGRHDFIGAADPARFHYQSEQLNASRTEGFAADLVREQERLMRADLLAFTFPLWWGGLPAIVKGWFDRVCAYGVAYADGKRFDKGYFIGRRAILWSHHRRNDRAFLGRRQLR